MDLVIDFHVGEVDVPRMAKGTKVVNVICCLFLDVVGGRAMLMSVHS